MLLAAWPWLGHALLWRSEVREGLSMTHVDDKGPPPSLPEHWSWAPSRAAPRCRAGHSSSHHSAVSCSAKAVPVAGVWFRARATALSARRETLAH